MDRFEKDTYDVLIPVTDGYELSATVFKAKLTKAKLIIINSATAVPRQFYTHFAKALCNAGYHVVTYDYRGINDSSPAKMRGFNALMRDWVLKDMTGVLNWTKDVFNPTKIFLIGHSIGGQLAGLLEDKSQISGMITFSAQSGHWRFQGGSQKLAVLLHCYLTLPILAKLFGYVPWSWFGAIDMPKNIAMEWAKWCRNKKYVLGDHSLPLERYENFTAPVLAYSFDDDNWGTQKSVDIMMKAYPNRERLHIEHKKQGIKKIGHIGFFKPQAKPLWADTISWLNAR
jgi:predicted alpha/beta hydrolase